MSKAETSPQSHVIQDKDDNDDRMDRMERKLDELISKVDILLEVMKDE